MDIMKLIYSGFGAFFGFVCGAMINLIFYWVEQAGHPFISNLPRKYGTFGYYVAEMTNFIPLLGLALGIVLVKWLFRDQWDKTEGD